MFYSLRKLLVVAWLFVLASCDACAELPNIILLMGDDHGWDETGYNGHPHLKTPVLDEMAASGLRLDRFYSAHPSCSPTRGSVMTGRHPNRYGTFAPNYSIRPEEITIAHLLNKAGYACGHFGKWHLGPVKAASPTSPGAMGFDEWLSHDNFFELNPTFSRNGGPPQKFEGESSEIVIGETIQFLAKARRKQAAVFCRRLVRVTARTVQRSGKGPRAVRRPASRIRRQTGEADIQRNRPPNQTAAPRCAAGTLRRDYGDGSFDRTASRVVEAGRTARQHAVVVLRRQWHAG